MSALSTNSAHKKPKKNKKKKNPSTTSPHLSLCPPSLSAFVDLPPHVTIIQLAPHLSTRLLYPNPVCLLTTQRDPSQQQEGSHRNVMTLSWLTAASNHGDVLCSINTHRYSVQLLQQTQRCVLNVVVEGMEEMVRRIGAESGQDTDKINQLQIPLCSVGWREKEEQDEDEDQSSSSPPAITGCVAHLLCKVFNVVSDVIPHHLVFHLTVDSAFVRSDYWDGKTFYPQSEQLPSYLAFLGSGRFAAIRTKQGELKNTIDTNDQPEDNTQAQQQSDAG